MMLHQNTYPDTSYHWFQQGKKKTSRLSHVAQFPGNPSFTLGFNSWIKYNTRCTITLWLIVVPLLQVTVIRAEYTEAISPSCHHKAKVGYLVLTILGLSFVVLTCLKIWIVLRVIIWGYIVAAHSDSHKTAEPLSLARRRSELGNDHLKLLMYVRFTNDHQIDLPSGK